MRETKKLLGVLALALLLGSCSTSNEKEDVAPSKGYVRVNIRKDAQESLPDSLSVSIRNASGQAVAQYASPAEIPSSGLVLPQGSYQLEVVPTNKKVALFNKPIYGGSTSFTVAAGSTTPVSISLKQANFGIGIAYSDKFKASSSGYTTTITSPQGTLAYSATESRLGYFYGGPLTVTVSYTDDKGAKKVYQQQIAASSSSIGAGSKLMLTVKFPNEASTGDGDSYTGYYQNASGKTGLALREALTTIISTGYKTKTYDNLWSAYKVGDLRTDGTGAIWDIYSDNPTGKVPYLFQPGQNQCGSYTAEGGCYNREHTVPKSWFKEASPMVSDYLHILPTDGYVNGRRSNYPYGEVGTAKWTSANGSKLGSAKGSMGYSGTVFEPIDAYKGDVARIYFYFVTRYADRLSSFEGNGEEIFDSKSGKGLDKWTIDMLLRWSKADPVSAKERTRNDEAEAFQSNRNPYVDHPEFIEKIWGGSTSATRHLAAVATLGASYKLQDIVVR
jgi:endonuclease I